MKVLLTGSAGFIGFHTAQALLARGDEVIGLDNFNPYYDPVLKTKRNERLEQHKGFRLVRGDVRSMEDLEKAFDLLGSGPDTRVCHLAAQAGVRYSIEHPDDFIQNNIQGTNNILECCRRREVGGLTFASSSSVYGANTQLPFSEEHNVDKPKSLYGASKKSNELQAFAYHNLYGLRCTGLRFFTVYGPWGRPDMALFLFTKWALAGKPLQIFGHGKMQRDFTFVQDIVSGVTAAIDKNYEYEIFNLAGGKVEQLMDYVQALEQALGMELPKEFLPMQQGDVVATVADISKARRMLGYDPQTHIDTGVGKFVEWYKEYYGG